MAGINKSLSIPVPTPGPTDKNAWEPLWPNPADVPYNYHNLLKLTAASGIANVSGRDASKLRIAIIGTGYGGLTAARELLRCGFTNITLYEADNRLSGRGYPVLPEPVKGRTPTGSAITPFELGAMRIPFFDPAGSTSGNSCIAFYGQEYTLRTKKFPDPGTPGMTTGIFMNEGYGPTPDPANFAGMLRWTPTQENPYPPDSKLKEVYAKWEAWSYNVKMWVSKSYGASSSWTDFWHKIVQVYEFLNFRDVALAAPKLYYRNGKDPDPKYLDANKNGDFGGLGLTVEQADLFYTIGAGDGSWGAFFDIAALYPMRTLLFGYADNHQLLGYVGKIPQLDGAPDVEPLKDDVFHDSANNPVKMPLFGGLSAVPAMHFFMPVRSAVSGINGTSLYSRMLKDRGSADGVKLYTGSPVQSIDVSGTGYKVATGTGRTNEHDILIFTPPGWSLQMNIDLSPAFMKKVFIASGGNDFWPALTSWKGMKMSHNITSAKVFFKLKKRYWEASNIPQVIVTDTFLQDVYGYALDVDAKGAKVNDPGVLLCSYTWEDDSNKSLSSHTSSAEDDFAKKCLAKLDEILLASGYPPMSNFVDTDYQPVVWHWEDQPLYRSCAKLYRAGSFDWNYAQLTWNQNHAKERGIYFAGEFASLEGGWIEPAMRGALDAVVRLIQNVTPKTDWAKVFNEYTMIQNYVSIPDWRPTPPQNMG